MSFYTVKNKTSSEIILSQGKDEIPIDIQLIQTPEGLHPCFEDINIDDLVFALDSGLVLKPANLAAIQNLEDYIQGLSKNRCMVSIYPKIRHIQPGSRNFIVAITIKIIEYSYLYKDPVLLQKLLQISNNNLIQYFIGNVNFGAFEDKMNALATEVNRIESLGKEILSNFGCDYTKLFDYLQIKIKLISYPDFNISVIGTSGIIEFVLLAYNGNFSILYTKKEVFLMDPLASPDFIKKYLKTVNFSDQLSAVTEKLRNSKQDLALIGSLIYEYISKMIDEDIIDNTIKAGIHVLTQIGVDVTVLLEKLQYKQCTKCSKSEDLIRITCGHGYCYECFMFIIEKATQGRYVLNDLEKENEPAIKCLIKDCTGVVTDFIIKQNLQNYEEYQKHADNRIRLECKCGTLDKSLKNFIISCHHICNDCLFEDLRKGQIKCSVCKTKIKELKFFRSMSSKCEGCYKDLNTMKFFIKKLCDHNLCIECLTSCSENLCVVDSKPLNIPDGFDLKSIKKRKCEFCSNNYDKMNPLEINKNCNCTVCVVCQFDSKNKCRSCEEVFPEIVIQYIIEQERVYNINIKGRVKTCNICFCEYDVENIINMWNCGDEFCETCFYGNLDTLVKENMIENILRCMICNKDINSGQLEHLIKNVDYLVPKNVADIIGLCKNCKNNNPSDIEKFLKSSNLRNREDRYRKESVFHCFMCDTDIDQKLIPDKAKEINELQENRMKIWDKIS